MKQPTLRTDNPYDRQFKMPKWNIQPTVLHDHRIFRHLPEFAGWTKDRHLTEAIYALTLSSAIECAYHHAMQDALHSYGDHGSLISGIGREHFPDEVKDCLRWMATQIGRQRDRSMAHWKAAGRRVETWRTFAYEKDKGHA